MIVFFDDPGDGVRVTADTITAGERSWALGELEMPRTVRPQVPRALPRLVALALLLSFATPVSWVAAGSRMALFVLVAALATGAAALLTARRPRAWELWADHRGAAVLLFTTTDAGRYGRVARALVRAADWRVLSDLGLTDDPGLTDSLGRTDGLAVTGGPGLADDRPGPVDDDHVDPHRSLAQDVERRAPGPGRDQIA